MLDTGVVLEDTRDECDGMKANQIIMRQLWEASPPFVRLGRRAGKKSSRRNHSRRNMGCRGIGMRGKNHDTRAQESCTQEF